MTPCSARQGPRGAAARTCPHHHLGLPTHARMPRTAPADTGTPLPVPNPQAVMRFGAGQMLTQKQPQFISPAAVERVQAGQGAPAESHGLSDPRGYFRRDFSPLPFVPSDVPCPTNGTGQRTRNHRAFCFVRLPLADSKGEPGIRAGAGQTDVVSLKEVSYLCHQPAAQQKRPRLVPAARSRSVSAGRVEYVRCRTVYFF